MQTEHMHKLMKVAKEMQNELEEILSFEAEEGIRLRQIERKGIEDLITRAEGIIVEADEPEYGVEPDVPHGTKVRVLFKGKWMRGRVVENMRDNDRLIVVRTTKKTEGTYLDGHGISVGFGSTTIKMGW